MATTEGITTFEDELHAQIRALDREIAGARYAVESHNQAAVEK